MTTSQSELERKLFLGGRLGRLRRDLGLTQTRMAEDLGVSPSYLNHLERNQRPVTAQILLRLAQTYDLDLRAFSGELDQGAEADLQEALADPLFRGLNVTRHEMLQALEQAPTVAEALVRLYRAYSDRRRRDSLGAGAAEDGVEEIAPHDWVRDYIQAHHNAFSELDALGEALAAEIGGTQGAVPGGFEAAGSRRLAEMHNIQVRLMPADAMPDWSRRFDPHRRQLRLVETLSAPSRAFAVAYQIAWLEQGDALNGLAEGADAPNLATRRTLKIALTNYLAAAMIMPYGAFQPVAEALGYDIGLLAARFGVSFEQACHRLTTLQRPSARGVPFFMLRIDAAGNVSKRFTSIAFPFARMGGACPRWNIHGAFRHPGQIVTQVIETPDKARYFTLARTVERPLRPHGSDAADLAVGLGCEIKYASRLVYARGVNLERATEVGPTCRLCERPACLDRAAPPVSRSLVTDELSKMAAPFRFSEAP
jgi:predicted transcriptional regulator/transcriptional regulator with XRE-family HTH domain